MGQNGGNSHVKQLIIDVLENGFVNNNYMKVIEVLDTCPGGETDILVYLLEYLGLNSVALNLIIEEYKIKRIRDVLELQLSDFKHPPKNGNDDEHDGIFTGPIADQVFEQ